MTKTNHKISAAIFKLLESEGTARYDYETFLAEFPGLGSADIKAIQEIQQDEANHMLILQAMAKKYDGGLSASPDGAAKAIKRIAEGIGDGN